MIVCSVNLKCLQLFFLSLLFNNFKLWITNILTMKRYLIAFNQAPLTFKDVFELHRNSEKDSVCEMKLVTVPFECDGIYAPFTF